MKSKSLVQSWLIVELVENEKTLAQALREMNKALDSRYTHSRVRQWEENRNGHGDRLPRKVRLYMAKRVVASVLKKHGMKIDGISKYRLNQIAACFV